jgi:hypothetical protein
VKTKTIVAPKKVEDVFETARQAFFSNGDGEKVSLTKHRKFTQVKSYDGPPPDSTKK